MFPCSSSVLVLNKGPCAEMAGVKTACLLMGVAGKNLFRSFSLFSGVEHKHCRRYLYPVREGLGSLNVKS